MSKGQFHIPAKINPLELTVCYRDCVIYAICKKKNLKWMTQILKIVPSTTSPHSFQLPKCRRGDQCGYIREDTLETYYSCSCPEHHLCVFMGPQKPTVTSMLHYQGNVYTGHCTPHWCVWRTCQASHTVHPCIKDELLYAHGGNSIGKTDLHQDIQPCSFGKYQALATPLQR